MLRRDLRLPLAEACGACSCLRQPSQMPSKTFGRESFSASSPPDTLENLLKINDFIQYSSPFEVFRNLCKVNQRCGRRIPNAMEGFWASKSVRDSIQHVSNIDFSLKPSKHLSKPKVNEKRRRKANPDASEGFWASKSVRCFDENASKIARKQLISA